MLTLFSDIVELLAANKWFVMASKITKVLKILILSKFKALFKIKIYKKNFEKIKWQLKNKKLDNCIKKKLSKLVFIKWETRRKKKSFAFWYIIYHTQNVRIIF